MWMAREPAMVELHTSAADAAKLMAQRRVRRVLVVETRTDGPRLLGIVSAKDVIHAFPPNVNPFAIEGPDARLTSTTVAQIMSVRPLTVTPDTPIEDAATLMCAHKIGSLPVLREQTLVGIITESDIFRAFAGLFSAGEKGARITFNVTQGEDVFELVGKLSRKHRLKISSLTWTRHEELPVCVVRVGGAGVDEMLDELWSSGHAIVNVIRFDGVKDRSVLPASPQPFQPFVLPEQKACGLYPSG